MPAEHADGGVEQIDAPEFEDAADLNLPPSEEAGNHVEATTEADHIAPASSIGDPLLDVNAAYDAHELVRPLQRFEISRDHLLFGDICGFDAGKRNVLHVLEERADDGSHGGVVLISAGNAVELLTLAPTLGGDENSATNLRAIAAQIRSAGWTATVIERRYLFGMSGAGVGGIAVHPSRRFFAVAEKGVKPHICVYQYPAAQVCRVLRNGTELAYSSVTFSEDGETLASVGSAPDFLLTVWNWREEQTILRCKAFGQDVFSVRFAPHDSGFLTTSGVGHIRFWKMASTFTGLKLQGDIGKFGKSELSDIEAFCVLPDKKVLSGTERGVLLLWDGNFIKCEIMTASRELPHQGGVRVVSYEPNAARIVTAGHDGSMIFWAFDAIDRADLPPDDNVALVEYRRRVVLREGLDIRAFVRQTDTRYLVQDGTGSIHLVLLSTDTSPAAPCHEVVLNYIPNETGRTTGIACSPYEHLAASCGLDGGIRAWDYVARRCLFTTMPPDPTPDKPANAAATCLAWVPNTSAVLTEVAPKSRQVAVGYSDGLIRVFLMDLIKRAWVRTNVFKPHNRRVSVVAFSTSGVFFATASDDSTFFLFKVVQSSKVSKITKYSPEYIPLGFQKTGSDDSGGIRSLSWREDDQAILLTLRSGRVIEYTIPMDGTLERLAEMKAAITAAGMEETTESDATNETYELSLSFREFTSLQKSCFMSTKELQAMETLNPNGNPIVDEKIRNQFQVETTASSLRAWTACYASKKDSFFLSTQNPLHGSLFVCQWGLSSPVAELASETSTDIAFLATSTSKKLVLCGLANGKFQLRSLPRPHAFLTGEFHDGSNNASSGGQHLEVLSSAMTTVATSFDDSFVLTAGSDGNISICRVYNEKVELAARLLNDKHENLLSEARIAGEQAQEKQQAQVDMMQKAAAEAAKNDDEVSVSGTSSGQGGDLASLPAYHRAKAFAGYVESRLDETSLDEESFRGVVRFLSDPNNAVGLTSAAPPAAPSPTDTAATMGVMEVADVQNASEMYTIEDAKRKSEADAKARATQSKQDRTREVLREMRAQLEELKGLDATYPLESRLDDDEWEIDLDYSEILAKQGEDACEEVRRELAYAVEREELLLLKLRETYVSPLAVELITLHAFESGLCVQSFRTMKMSSALQKRLNEIHTNDTNEAKRLGATSKKKSSVQSFHSDGSPDSPARASMSHRPSVLHIMSNESPLDDEFPLKEEERKMMQQRNSIVSGGGLTHNPHLAGHYPPGAPAHSDGVSSGGSVHGFEARKRLRADRKDKLEQWRGNKPGEDADDPRDLVAIAFAQRNMGDYKLKTAQNYVVPEDQRVNTAKKRKQMALLEEKMYEARLTFNAKVLELRELKLLLVQEMRQDELRVKALQQALLAYGDSSLSKSQGIVGQLEIDLSEWPEQRERVSDADIELYLKEKLVTAHSQMDGRGQADSTPQASSNNHRRGSNCGSGARILDGKKIETTDRSIVAVSRRLGRVSSVNEPASGANNLSGQMHEGRSVPILVRNIPNDDLAIVNSGPSQRQRNLDRDANIIRVYLVRREIQQLLRKRRDEIRAFDDAVAHLRREKMRLDVVFKKCELRLFTLLSELVLLEQFESRENLLSSKLDKSKSEKAQIVAEINDIQENMSAKKKEMEEWTRQEKAVQAEFLTLVNGSGSGSGGLGSTQHPNFAALQKIFKKKIKRPKKKGGSGGNDGKDGGTDGDGDPSNDRGNGDGDDEDDEEDEDDSDFDEDDDDDDDDDEEDVCPAGCDLQLYEKVLALREKRADVDDAMSDLNKSLEELRKNNDRQVAKQRQIDKELQATEQDIQLFQSEKQMRFNQLDVVVSLSKHQLRCLVTPTDGTPSSSSWQLPEQASNCLVFGLSTFEALTERIDSLQRENRSLRQQFRDLHKQQNVLAREKNLQQQRISQIQHKCEQLQLLKFGQLVDIELLDKACDTTRVAERQAKVRARELDAERELVRVRQQHQQLQRQILEATEQNTALLGQLAALSERQLALERELNHANASQSVLHDETEELEREMRERNKLVKVVKLQAREIDALKQEIGLLRGKDGKVYAPRA
ncbi:hypothetical protein PINS_up009289 [Pythium insidiosum]|nr:hypothetical protein PINS_up009289 [Pythium insidiosum]